MSGTASVPTAYEFDETTQTEIASCIMFDSEFARRTQGLVKPHYFGNEIEAIYVDLATRHFDKYGEAPSGTVWKELIKDAITTGRFRSDQRVDAVHKLAECAKLTVRSRGWLMDAIAEFAKQQAVVAAMTEAVNAVFKTTDPERFRKAETVLSDAFTIALKTEDEDYDYFERIEERTEERKEIMAGGRPKTGVTTGVEELDALLYHQGWGRQELSALMGGAKASKSFHLTFFAGMAAQAGHNVLLITLENSIKITASRLDAMMSGVGLSEEFRSPYAMEGGVRGMATRPGMGKIKIRRAPAGVFTPSGLRRMLDEYKTKGIRFDLIVIDYTDLMAPDHWTQNPIENSKAVLVGVRQVAVDENAAVLTAFQTNREGHKSAVVKADQVAEDFNKIRIADIVLGINRTEDERAEAKSRITFAAARNQPDGYTLFVVQDLDHGMAIKEVEKVE